MSLDSLSPSDLDAGPQSRAQAPPSTCTPHRAPLSLDSPDTSSPEVEVSPQPHAVLSSTKKITTLHHLRSLVPHSYCIGIDVEGIEGIAQGITSVGISVLPPFIPPSSALSDSSNSEAWPWPFPDLHNGHLNLDTLSTHYRLQSHCFAILGRERARSYEHFHYGTVTHFPLDQLQDAVISAISQSIPLLEANTAPIILVGFDMSLETRAISSLLPSLTNYITYWVDISSLVLSNAVWDPAHSSHSSHSSHSPSSSSPHKPHLKISLRDTLSSLSFLRNHSIQPRARHHSAGMDAVRTLGVMLALLARGEKEEGVVVRRYTWEEHSNRKLWEWVPRPTSKFPWTVKVVPVPSDREDGDVPIPVPFLQQTRMCLFLQTKTKKKSQRTRCTYRKVSVDQPVYTTLSSETLAK